MYSMLAILGQCRQANVAAPSHICRTVVEIVRKCLVSALFARNLWKRKLEQSGLMQISSSHTLAL